MESQTAIPFLALLASPRLASPYLQPSVPRPFALAEVKAALKMGFSPFELEQMQSYWGKRGIPGSLETLPVDGESLKAKLGGPIGKGTMGTVVECSTANGIKAFKTPTGANCRYEQPTGMNPRHPNVEGRAMLAAELANRLLPAGCGLVVPKTRMAKIGADFGLLMDKFPGKSRMIRVLHNRSLKDQSELSRKLLRKLQKHGINARKTLEAIHLHGLQSIRLICKQDGSVQVHVTGQVLHESPSIVAHPDYKRALTWLQLFDFLTGQMDRHSGNILIEEYRDPETGEQRVRIGAIDNECCFGVLTEHSEFASILDTHAFLLPQLPEAIDAEMFEAITQFQIPPGLAQAYLGEQRHVGSLLRRLDILQQHCRNLAESKAVMSAGDWQGFSPTDPASSLWQRESMSVSKEIQQVLEPTQ